MTGEFYDKTERWKLILTECNTNKQAVTIVRLRKKDNAPVVSVPSCLTQSHSSLFSLERTLRHNK